MMKSPDEIKKALECCFYESEQCGDCPYYPVSCDRELVRDAREYIRQLEAGIAEWEDVAASPGAVEDMARENTMLTKYARQREKQVTELSASNVKLQKEVFHLKAERERLIDTIRVYGGCEFCLYSDCDMSEEPCLYCFDNERWQWRGVQKEE